jgi:hypothetical protein
LNQLEHGYSVSDTDEEKGGLLSGIGEADIISLKSGLSLMAMQPHLAASQGVRHPTG